MGVFVNHPQHLKLGGLPSSGDFLRIPQLMLIISFLALEWDFTDYAERAAKIGVELARCIYGEQSAKYHRWIQITQDTLDR